MAAMGVPAGGGRNELDCRLRDGLDHDGLLRQRLRPPSWKDHIGDSRVDFSASAARLCRHVDLLVHPALDVPAQDLLKDLTHAFQFSRQKPGPRLRRGVLALSVHEGWPFAYQVSVLH